MEVKVGLKIKNAIKLIKAIGKIIDIENECMEKKKEAYEKIVKLVSKMVGIK